MQKFISKYALAAHLALLAVAPLFLSPLVGEGTVATVLLWLSPLAAAWVLLEPSRRADEMLHDARVRVASLIASDPLFWFLLLAVVLAYACWAWNALKISLSANFRLGMLLGFGLTMMISCQALINMAVISGSIPTKGMPAPFISYGGSNMIVSMITVGLLISIAEETVNPGYSDRYTAWLRGFAARFRRHENRS